MTVNVSPGLAGLVRVPKTAELIAAQIRRWIVRHEFEPGTSLPSEPELLRQFGVSRPTLREAYRILEVESLISIRRGVGGGAVVLAPDPRVGARFVGLLLQFAGATIADVYEARTTLEPICAARMAARRDPQAIAGLRASAVRVSELIASSPQGMPDPHIWSRTTYEFHELVLAGCGNQTLALHGELLHEVVSMHYAATALAERLAAHRRPERFQRVLRSFEQLVVHVAAGDQDSARTHWTTHMTTAANTLLGADLRDRRIVDLFG